MAETEPVSGPDSQTSRHVFVSFATSDRKQALSVCKSIESRDIRCWISTRDVAPGENYQEAIVHALRDARSMVLVYSRRANDSDEIKKELSLASRYQVPVLVLRTEPVEPSGAFAYELSTRQWIDAFNGWERSIDSLVGRIGQISGATSTTTVESYPGVRNATAPRMPSRTVVAAAGALLVVLAAGGWWWLRPSPTAAHSMAVRLTGFESLSTDLPATMRSAVDAEIGAAFSADGVIGVSNAAAPPQGATSAYALGGTIQRAGSTIRVISRLTNERSGAILWTDTFNYDGTEVRRVPRHIAVDAGNVVRCGLFGASTYRKPLTDAVLKDYLQFCQGHWDPNLVDGRKALIPAQRVVTALPDFSWGWAAVAGGFWKVALSSDSDLAAREARASGREAADRALAIDSKNSEALWIKSMLVERNDWAGREDLLKRAIAARRLDCGCEHHQYGWMLLNVGRVSEAVDHLRRANDMLALYLYTSLNLADALIAAGKPGDAKPYFDAAIDLSPNAEFAGRFTAVKAIETGDTNALLDPNLQIPPAKRLAALQAHRAIVSGKPNDKQQAVRSLLALPDDQQNDTIARLLAELGATSDAFRIASRIASRQYPGPSVFWYRSMRRTLDDPGFPAEAARLGLLTYWRATRSKPDVCGEQAPPAFCRTI